MAEVTDALATAMSVSVRALPATEDEVGTRIRTADGRDMHYEEFLVRHGASPAVRSVAYARATAARPAPGVLEAVTAADLLILGPSNPVASIGPIFAVPGLREAVRDSPADVVAVTPVVTRRTGGRNRRGAAGDQQGRPARRGRAPSTATAVAGLYPRPGGALRT
ncbi:MAG: 2-phospho-L-lactate transferase CofD family protein [Geodermatophilaceae bacterium]